MRPAGWAGAALAMALAWATNAAAAEWTGSWASAQMPPSSQDALAPADMAGATLRQIVRLSAGGSQLRVRVSNAFGHGPLRLAGAHVALAVRPGSPAIVAGSDRAVSFAGASTAVIPAGAEYWSDPVPLPVAPGAALAVSLRFEAAPDGQTSHPGSRATSFLLGGDHLGDRDLPGARGVEHWYQLSGVDVSGAARRRALVALGDSITDGHGATTNGDDRWPDVLARRLRATAAGRGVGVMNAGIGGNRVLLDGLGPNAVARFGRDVLSQSGASAVLVLEGVNDMGVLTRDAPVPPEAHAALVRQLTTAYGQIIATAHAHGLRVIGGTITPYGGSGYYHPDAANEADRQAVNRWIRSSGRFDAVADFDKALRDPAHPDRLAPAFDGGDHLHPSPAGYRAMAAAVPLAELTR